MHLHHCKSQLDSWLLAHNKHLSNNYIQMYVTVRYKGLLHVTTHLKMCWTKKKKNHPVCFLPMGVWVSVSQADCVLFFEVERIHCCCLQPVSNWVFIQCFAVYMVVVVVKGRICLKWLWDILFNWCFIGYSYFRTAHWWVLNLIMWHSEW